MPSATAGSRPARLSIDDGLGCTQAGSAMAAMNVRHNRLTSRCARGYAVKFGGTESSMGGSVVQIQGRRNWSNWSREERRRGARREVGARPGGVIARDMAGHRRARHRARSSPETPSHQFVAGVDSALDVARHAIAAVVAGRDAVAEPDVRSVVAARDGIRARRRMTVPTGSETSPGPVAETRRRPLTTTFAHRGSGVFRDVTYSPQFSLLKPLNGKICRRVPGAKPPGTVRWAGPADWRWKSYPEALTEGNSTPMRQGHGATTGGVAVPRGRVWWKSQVHGRFERK